MRLSLAAGTPHCVLGWFSGYLVHLMFAHSLRTLWNTCGPDQTVIDTNRPLITRLWGEKNVFCHQDVSVLFSLCRFAGIGIKQMIKNKKYTLPQLHHDLWLPLCRHNTVCTWSCHLCCIVAVGQETETETEYPDWQVSNVNKQRDAWPICLMPCRCWIRSLLHEQSHLQLGNIC